MSQDEVELERLLRRLRQRIFDYAPDKSQQASRLILKVRTRLAPYWERRAKQLQDRYLERWFDIQ